MKNIYVFLFCRLGLCSGANPLNAQWVRPMGGWFSDILPGTKRQQSICRFVRRRRLSIDNDGKDWTSVRNNLQGNVFTLAVFAGNVYAGTDNYNDVTTDNGSAWTQIDSGLGSNWSGHYMCTVQICMQQAPAEFTFLTIQGHPGPGSAIHGGICKVLPSII